MRKLEYLFLLILFFGCCDQSDLLKNGLAQKATRITEYTIKLENDSLNNKTQDTLVIIEKTYNENDQIIRRLQRNLFVNDTMDIGFVYSQNKLMQETVRLSEDTTIFTVNYIYKDSILEKTISEFSSDIFEFKQLGKYYYDSNNKLIENTVFQYYLSLDTKDTITKTFETNKYDNNEFVIERKAIDYIDSNRNRKFIYEYKCNKPDKTLEFDSKDSLISKVKYKYKIDDFGNWIERKSIKNDTLDYLKIRIIDYK